MSSSNFDLLKKRWPSIYEFGASAERLVYFDPHSSIIKLRCMIEQIVGTLYRELNLPAVYPDKLFEKLDAKLFKEIVDEDIITKFHAIRIKGNSAAHPKPHLNPITSRESLGLLKEAYLICQWMYKTYSGELYEGYPPFIEPKSVTEQLSTLEVTNEDLQKQLASAKQELVLIEQAEKQALAQVHQLNEALDEVKLSAFKSASRSSSETIDLTPSVTASLITIFDIFAEYQLTDGQLELVKRLNDFLTGRNHDVFLLRGYAGTGKTFITKGLTEFFKAVGRNYILSAPTGKASKVIANKTQSPAYTIHKTIYSMKDISEYRDDDIDGTETYKVYAEVAVNEMPDDTVYIVDEASMIADMYQDQEFFRFGSGYLLRDFLKYVKLDHNDHRKKIILIGDDAQLPPVTMKFSPALNVSYLTEHFNVKCDEYELTEVVRQKAASGVMNNAIKLRQAIDSNTFNQLVVEDQFPDIKFVEHKDFLTRYLETCNSKINGESIVIAQSNADVAAFNRQIREYFFPEHPTITAGDKVMAVNNSNAYGFFISNGDFGLVKQVSPEVEERTVTLKRKIKETGETESIPITLRFRKSIVGFKELDGTPRFFEAMIYEDLLYSDQATLSSDENKALYLDFCIRHPGLKRGSREFKDTLIADPYFNALRLKFGYAITCHKAQGSEWNNVFVKCRTNQSQLTMGYFRWFYTAITRTASTLYLMDPPKLKLGGGITLVSNPGMSFSGEVNAPKEDVNSNSNVIPKTEEVVTSPVITVGHEAQNTFDIPTGNSFLMGMLEKVRSYIAGHGIEIEHIDHKPYLELYFFKRGQEHCRVNINYNGKSKVTNVSAIDVNQLGSDVVQMLAGLKAAIISTEAAAAQGVFEEDFLNQFHERLTALAIEQGLVVPSVQQYNYCQRYTFTRAHEVAVFNIYYNGKKQFSRCEPMNNLSTPGPLMNEVVSLITKGMS
ncbi:MAG TPA: exonuclease V subunit alpha [Alteromonas macleodii]|nr:exonuclease V subunit alpha [Alteromonas macleodii]